MEIMINYQGRPRKVTLSESKKYPVDTVYECEIEGVGKIELAYDYEGKPVELKNDKHIRTVLADLIDQERDRVEKATTNEDSFPVSLDYKGKRYDLIITTIPTDAGPYYRVVQSGRFLFYVFPPSTGQHQWHAGHGNDNDQHLAAVIGIAIESR